jgi:hypothetical protein
MADPSKYILFHGSAPVASDDCSGVCDDGEAPIYRLVKPTIKALTQKHLDLRD